MFDESVTVETKYSSFVNFSSTIVLRNSCFLSLYRIVIKLICKMERRLPMVTDIDSFVQIFTMHFLDITFRVIIFRRIVLTSIEIS